MNKEIHKGDLEFQLFEDFWKFRKKYYYPTEENHFIDICKEIETIMSKYNNTELEHFARELLFTHLDDVTYRMKENANV